MIKRKKACEEHRKAAGQEESRKGEGEHMRKAGRPLVRRKPQRYEESL